VMATSELEGRRSGHDRGDGSRNYAGVRLSYKLAMKRPAFRAFARRATTAFLSLAKSAPATRAAST